MVKEEYFNGEEWQEYLRLQKERPEAFAPSDYYTIITEPDRVFDFVNRTGRKIGVLYRSSFSILVVDLVSDKSGDEFAYERLLPSATGSAVVMIPELGDKFVLLRQFRHSIRHEQLAFPRGFGEEGLGAAENAAKEIYEELGAEITEQRVLGEVTGDSGILGTKVTVIECTVNKAAPEKGNEGIIDLLLLSEDEMNRYISSGKITDGYTLAAWALHSAK